MGAILSYILPAIEIRLLGKFHPDSYKTSRLVCVETDMTRSTGLVMLIKNMYTLWGRIRFLYRVANLWLKSLYSLQSYKNITATLDDFTKLLKQYVRP